jgi:hypothetical protein
VMESKEELDNKTKKLQGNKELLSRSFGEQ